MIYAVKTVVGREKVVLEAIAAYAQQAGIPIKGLVHPEEIKGYIFVEGEPEEIELIVRRIPHARGMIRKPTPLSEIEKFLQPKKMEVELEPGDLVEVIGGPFKGERGKVIRYDKLKRELTVEFIEVAVPIPVTISVEFVKLLKKRE
jgi:transcriptional antiterminator NusG